MNEFTPKEIQILLFLTRNRLKYEARRPRRINPDTGSDMQQLKTLELVDIAEKLERKLNATGELKKRQATERALPGNQRS